MSAGPGGGQSYLKGEPGIAVPLRKVFEDVETLGACLRVGSAPLHWVPPPMAVRLRRLCYYGPPNTRTPPGVLGGTGTVLYFGTLRTMGYLFATMASWNLIELPEQWLPPC